MEVVFSYNYGDRCQSLVAATIRSINEGAIMHSDYLRSDTVCDEGAEEARAAVILS